MPRRSTLDCERAAPSVRALPLVFMGQRPNQGPSPRTNRILTAGQSPASHQGGEAGVDGVKFTIGS